MKQINKATLDELIRLERKYWETSDTDILDARIKTAFELSSQAFGCDLSWIKFADIVSSIVGGSHALKPKATNADIYKVLELLGFEVADDAPEQEATHEP